LAVVVITRGTDAHRHLPAAVAGQIYRDLHQRFGTPTNLRVNPTLDDEEKEIGTADGDELIADQDSTAAEDNTNTVTTVAPATHKLVPEQSPNTVKRVLLPINSTPKADTQKTSTGTKTSVNPPTQPDNRPRRTQEKQP
jgi:hypothetical protein